MVVHAYYPIGEPRVQREARAALNFGYQVTVICLRGNGESARERIDGVDVRRLSLQHGRGARLEAVSIPVLSAIVSLHAGGRKRGQQMRGGCPARRETRWRSGDRFSQGRVTATSCIVCR